jgi:hypothetical protein
LAGQGQGHGGQEPEMTNQWDCIVKYTRYWVKKKEKENGSGELNPLIYITPSSHQEAK